VKQRYAPSDGSLPQRAIASVQDYFVASATHFFTKLFFAAPYSFFAAACASQVAWAEPPLASFSHFCTKLVFAAPDRCLSAAFASHPESAAS